MSKEPLKLPVVTCALGLLYNKEIIIKNLIDKTIPPALKHIRSLKDVIDVNFKLNPHYNPKGEKGHDSVNITDWEEESPFICPITNIEVGGNHRFSVLLTCGCAFSERALRECPSEVCLVCNKPFTSNDILHLNPEEEELKELKLKLKEKRKLEKKEKKEKQQGGKRVQFDTDITQKDKRKLKELQPVSGSIDISLKKTKKVIQAPANATPEIYASLFTSSTKAANSIQESFACRNVSRG